MYIISYILDVLSCCPTAVATMNREVVSPVMATCSSAQSMTVAKTEAMPSPRTPTHTCSVRTEACA